MVRPTFHDLRRRCREQRQTQRTLFKYLPLPREHIRLVRQHLRQDKAPRYEISIFALDAAPAYTALSYEWRDLVKPGSIIANGRFLPVTTNLEAFLDELATRRKNAFGAWTLDWLWIDAICIDQANPVERSEQVARMKDIYEKAQAIIIWLGQSHDDDGAPMQLLRDVAALKCDQPSLRDASGPGVLCRFETAEAHIDITYEALNDAIEILQSDYWDRVWILQEASTPRQNNSSTPDVENTEVWYSSQSMTLKALTAVQYKFEVAHANPSSPAHLLQLGTRNARIGCIRYLSELRSSQGRLQESLYSMLAMTRNGKATDPRDKLYAVLKLTDQRHLEKLQPDYSRSVEDVYTQLAKDLIVDSENLDCLGSAGLEKQYGVPTWVPDWTVMYDVLPIPILYQLRQTQLSTGKDMYQTHLFNACGGRKLDVGSVISGQSLKCYGFCFDLVTKVSQPRTFSESRGVWKSWTAVAQPDRSAYPGGGSRVEAFQKTVTANLVVFYASWCAERGSHAADFCDPKTDVFPAKNYVVDIFTHNRLLFSTSNGYMGIAAMTAEPGDQVCILAGAQTPLVLRQEGDHYLLVGQAYVHGIMDGEACEHADKSHAWRCFTIA